LRAGKAGALEELLRIACLDGRSVRAREHLLPTSGDALPHRLAERRHTSGDIGCARGRAKRSDHDFERLSC
jgi:hypothetical protein